MGGACSRVGLRVQRRGGKKRGQATRLRILRKGETTEKGSNGWGQLEALEGVGVDVPAGGERTKLSLSPEGKGSRGGR